MRQLKTITYNDDEWILIAHFHDNTTYRYLNVARSVYEQLLASDDTNAFFNQNIDGTYRRR